MKTPKWKDNRTGAPLSPIDRSRHVTTLEAFIEKILEPLAADADDGDNDDCQLTFFAYKWAIPCIFFRLVCVYSVKDTILPQTNVKIGGRLGSVESIAPTILRPRARIPSTTSTLFFNLHLRHVS